jgi:predicted metalloprotease with PDZ domain
MELRVDATDAPRRITRSHFVVPARPGPLTLVYPKWIPGEHGPTGPIVNMAGLVVTSGGKTIAWRRDSEHLYEFHLDVPAGAAKLDIDLVFLEPSDLHGFSGGPSTTDQLLDLSWNRLVLYPKGLSPELISVSASLKLPVGWKYATALPVARQAETTVEFAPATLAALIDSPIVAGAHTRVIPLGPEVGPPVEIDLVADSDEALEMTDQQIAAYRQVVSESLALFGARHYRNYHFLYLMSDKVESFGLEHHESSEDRVGERTLVEDDRRRARAGLLPHEFVHSWNGKYRRPRGLATRDYQEPMRGDLLWIYEGLTEYLGWVLTGRSGLLSEQEQLEGLAEVAAHMDAIPGRRWRSLEDTAIAAQVLYESAQEWGSMRRSVDFYPEGLLIWLEADVLIRHLTQGKASLDDFCRNFFGGRDGSPEVRPYDLDEVIADLTAVARYDWRGFFEGRIMRPTEHAPLGGIVNGGYKLVFTDRSNARMRAIEKTRQFHEMLYSLGFLVDEHDKLIDVLPDHPGATAGLAPGMRLVAVFGRHYSTDVLRDALAHTRNESRPLEFLVESSDYFKTIAIDWHGGERHPHLERDASRPDVLTQILVPRTPRPAGAVASPPKEEDERKR